MRDRPVPKLDVSFTGTSHHDLTTRQVVGLSTYLQEHRAAIRTLHLGDCIKADEQMYELACALGLDDTIILHPPFNNTKRAYCHAARSVRPRPYLIRNRMMAEACNTLLAAPAQAHEVVRSGTWHTIRCARKLDKRIIIFNP